MSNKQNNIWQATWYSILLREKIPVCSVDVAASCKGKALPLGFTVAFEGGIVYQERNMGNESVASFQRQTIWLGFFSGQVLVQLRLWQVTSSVIHIIICPSSYSLCVLHFIGAELWGLELCPKPMAEWHKKAQSYIALWSNTEPFFSSEGCIVRWTLNKLNYLIGVKLKLCSNLLTKLLSYW